MSKPQVPNAISTGTDMAAGNNSNARTCCLFVPIRAGVAFIILLSLLCVVLPFFLPAIDTDNEFLYGMSVNLTYADTILFVGKAFFLFTVNPPGFCMLAIVDPVFVIASFVFGIYSALAIVKEYKQRDKASPKFLPLWKPLPLRIGPVKGCGFVCKRIGRMCCSCFQGHLQRRPRPRYKPV